MEYNTKTRKYIIVKGTMLSKEIGENGKITDPGVRYFYIKNKKKNM